MKEKASTIIALVAILAAAVGVAVIMPALSQQAHADACNQHGNAATGTITPAQCSNSVTGNAGNTNIHVTHLNH